MRSRQPLARRTGEGGRRPGEGESIRGFPNLPHALSTLFFPPVLISISISIATTLNYG